MPNERKPCPYCALADRRKQAIRLKRHRYNKAFAAELRQAQQSGKVVTLYQQDEFTGIYYRLNKHGQYVEGGRGKYNYV